MADKSDKKELAASDDERPTARIIDLFEALKNALAEKPTAKAAPKEPAPDGGSATGGGT